MEIFTAMLLQLWRHLLTETPHYIESDKGNYEVGHRRQNDPNDDVNSYISYCIWYVFMGQEKHENKELFFFQYSLKKKKTCYKYTIGLGQQSFLYIRVSFFPIS